MTYPSLNTTATTVDTSLDSIVIVDNFQSVRGGRTLDTTGFTPTVIKSGHVIIQDTTTKDYKPMPLNGGATAYTTLPSGHVYAGILISSLLTARPFAGIMLRGTVNLVAATASSYDPSTILTAVKAALPLIIFTQD